MCVGGKSYSEICFFFFCFRNRLVTCDLFCFHDVTTTVTVFCKYSFTILPHNLKAHNTHRFYFAFTFLSHGRIQDLDSAFCILSRNVGNVKIE